MIDFGDQRWVDVASRLLRLLLLPDRQFGCICTRCLIEEIHKREDMPKPTATGFHEASN